ncbi:hypothetical protein [Paractinoplanes brasiliensis]|uniref:hypothetical protein n=1 Tax=Paractinoplanes brasiliensis TaxID=52695 RepID=UPI00105F4F2C|nr:hypothetical protein [Actinoplanes brasiliensis]GID31075.1 hypothetical protein Abr02nite_60580 [Actinoplanes brasiliensis]
MIFGYFGTLTDPGAHRTGELLGVCRPRFWEALAGSFGERTIGVHDGTESSCRYCPVGSLIATSSSQWRQRPTRSRRVQEV